MSRFRLIGVTALVLLATACNKDGAGKVAVSADPLVISAQQQFKAIPASYKDIPGNQASDAQVALGAMLYHDPRLSGSHALSCASCHNIGLGGGDDASTSVGHNFQQGGRNAPTVLNATFNFAQFWDGRARNLFEQAGGPMVNPIEMNSPKDHVAEQLRSIPGYAKPFADAFPGQASPITLENVQTAIAAFESTLITPNAPFDQFLQGKSDALTAEQKDGLKLFMDKGCAACHSGINVGGGMYAKFGVATDPGEKYRPAADKGRMAVTGDTADEFSFKVPTLRNVTLTAPYFHTGSAWDLKEAIRVMGKAQLGQDLSNQEVDRIAAFLGSLQGDQPKVLVPILPASGPDTTKPVRN